MTLHRLTHSLITWSSKHLPSLRTTHIPSVLNTMADLLSRGNQLYQEFRHNSEIVHQLWERFGQICLHYAKMQNVLLFFSLRNKGMSLRIKDAPMAKGPTCPIAGFGISKNDE